MAHLCEKLEIDIDDVLQGIGLDKRIGHDYLKPGPDFGGSCLAKDALALIHIAQSANAASHIIESILESNSRHKNIILEKIISACLGSVLNKRLAILGVSFKANTDDVRNSTALYIISELHAKGAILSAYFRNLSMNSTIIDFRNLYSPKIVADAGIRYISIGRIPAEPADEEILEKNLCHYV